jgi:hypothetical protein
MTHGHPRHGKPRLANARPASKCMLFIVLQRWGCAAFAKMPSSGHRSGTEFLAKVRGCLGSWPAGGGGLAARAQRAPGRLREPRRRRRIWTEAAPAARCKGRRGRPERHGQRGFSDAGGASLRRSLRPDRRDRRRRMGHGPCRHGTARGPGRGPVGPRRRRRPGHRRGGREPALPAGAGPARGDPRHHRHGARAGRRRDGAGRHPLAQPAGGLRRPAPPSARRNPRRPLRQGDRGGQRLPADRGRGPGTARPPGRRALGPDLRAGNRFSATPRRPPSPFPSAMPTGSAPRTAPPRAPPSPWARKASGRTSRTIRWASRWAARSRTSSPSPAG